VDRGGEERPVARERLILMRDLGPELPIRVPAEKPMSYLHQKRAPLGEALGSSFSGTVVGSAPLQNEVD
jgi:hypothetical protein